MTAPRAELIGKLAIALLPPVAIVVVELAHLLAPPLVVFRVAVT